MMSTISTVSTVSTRISRVCWCQEAVRERKRSREIHNPECTSSSHTVSKLWALVRHYQFMQMLKLTALSCKLQQSTTLEGEEKLSDLCNMEWQDERKKKYLASTMRLHSPYSRALFSVTWLRLRLKWPHCWCAWGDIWLVLVAGLDHQTQIK